MKVRRDFAVCPCAVRVVGPIAAATLLVFTPPAREASAAPTEVTASRAADTGDAGATGIAGPGAAEPRSYENPFAPFYAHGPGMLRAGLHMGSMHRDGVGPRVWFVPWDYLELSASYAYRTEHSFAGTMAVPLFPRAPMTPYLTAGYGLAITTLPYGLRMTTHQIIAGLGLEARVLGRYFLGAEVTMNTIWKVTLKNKRETMELSPGEHYSFVSGFHVGVSFL